jgi:polyisoprenoid-binding protein YceI
MTVTLRAAILLVLALWGAAISAAEWGVDTGRSKLGFVASYDRIPFEARFERFTADIRLDAARSADGHMEATMQVSSINSRSADRDEGMQGPEWFHAAKFPTARFVSRRIAANADGSYRVTGDLTIKGITRAVEFPFRWSEQDRTARLHGETAVKRTDFDIGTGEWKTDDTIGFEVKIVFDLELRKK